MSDEYRAGFLYSFKVLFRALSWFIRLIKFCVYFFPQVQISKTFLECTHPKYIFYLQWWFERDSIVAPLVFQFDSIYFQLLKIFLMMPRFLFHFVLQKQRFHHSKLKLRNEFEIGSLAEVLSSDVNEYQNWKIVDKNDGQKLLTKIIDKNYWQKLLTKVVDKSCWLKLLTKVVDKSRWQKLLIKIFDITKI